MMTEPANPQKLLNVKQLAERLGVARRSIHYWLRAGTLPIQPIEGMKPPKWRAADVDAFLEAR